MDDLTTLVEHVDEAICMSGVFGYENGYVLLDVGHAHAVQVEAEINGKVCIDDVVQVWKLYYIKYQLLFLILNFMIQTKF